MQRISQVLLMSLIAMMLFAGSNAAVAMSRQHHTRPTAHLRSHHGYQHWNHFRFHRHNRFKRHHGLKSHGHIRRHPRRRGWSFGYRPHRHHHHRFRHVKPHWGRSRG